MSTWEGRGLQEAVDSCHSSYPPRPGACGICLPPPIAPTSLLHPQPWEGVGHAGLAFITAQAPSLRSQPLEQGNLRMGVAEGHSEPGKGHTVPHTGRDPGNPDKDTDE